MILRVVKSGSDGNSYILESNGQIILLDLGCSWKDIQKACDYNVSAIDFALVTHEHEDHARYIKDVSRMGIDVFSSHEVRKKYPYCEWIPRNKKHLLCGWQITAFTVPHTHNDGEKCLNYAYMIEKDGERLLYLTDWMYCPYDLSQFNINHFLIAVNYTDLEDDKQGKIGHILLGHSSLNTVKDFLKTSMTDACRNIICCHLSQRNSDEEMILTELKELAPNVNVTIARKGGIVEL